MITKKLLSLLCVLALSTTLMGFDEDELRRVCEAFPSQEICKKSLKQIWKIQKKLDACCTDLDIKFDGLIDEIQRINGCITPTPISTSTVITEPGNYCLTADITSGAATRITIDADNVLLDLNDHAIDGGDIGILIDGQSNVIIKNGTIRNTNQNAIRLFNSDTIELSNVLFNQNSRCCLIFNLSGFRVSNCNFVNNSFISGSNGIVHMNTGSNGIIRSCFFYTNPATALFMSFANCEHIMVHDVHVANNITDVPADTKGFFFSNTDDCFFYKCTVNNNSNDNADERNFEAFDLAGGSARNIFLECTANNNRSTDNTQGFFMEVGAENIFHSCEASSNQAGVGIANGFLIQSDRCCIINCLAKSNEDDGFFASSVATNNLLLGNIAIGNGGNGFDETTNGNNGWFSNYAAKNTGAGGNYSTIPAANIKSYTFGSAVLPANTVAWNNIQAVP